MRISPEELFVRRFDDLVLGLKARDNYEVVKVGAILRQLLLDDTPLIHKANRQHRLKLRFIVNDISSKELPVQLDVHFVASGLDPSMLSMATGTKSVSLDQFLGLQILSSKTNKFTIRELIKYAANKAGGVHHGDTLDGREAELLRILEKVGGLGFSPITLALRSIARVTLTTLAPLREAIVKLPTSLSPAAHYKVNKEGSIHFAGKQFLETDNMNLKSAPGFSWNGVLRVTDQPRAGRRVIYEVGRWPQTRNSSRFTIYLNGKSEIGCTARLNSKKLLDVIAPSSNAFPLFDHFIYLSCELCLDDAKATLSLWINESIISNATVAYQGTLENLNRQVIGATLAGKRQSAFYIRELVLAHRCLDTKERMELAKYFWLEWHD
jgi:hypothetical protein